MRPISRRLLLTLLAAVVIVIALVLAQCSAIFSASGPVGLAYQSKGWSYLQVSHGAQRGFEAPGFNAGPWRTGQAGFGTLDRVCPWNDPAKVHTVWQPNTDMLLRHDFRAKRGPGVMHINGTVDNDADVYVNGVLIQHVEDGSCGAGGINVDIPGGILRDDNVIAVRAVDLGDATYVDVEIVYVASPNAS